MSETATAAISKARRYWLRSTWLPRLGSRLASRSCCRRVYLSSASIICREMSIGGVLGPVGAGPAPAGGRAGGGGRGRGGERGRGAPERGPFFGRAATRAFAVF